MTLYAVCFSEDVQDEQLISVVESESKEEVFTLHYHFRKSMKTNSFMRALILDLSYDGFFYSYFDGNLDKFDVFSNDQNFISIMKKNIGAWVDADDCEDVTDETLKWLTDEMCVVAANYIIEIDDIEKWSGPHVVVEVPEIPTV